MKRRSKNLYVYRGPVYNGGVIYKSIEEYTQAYNEAQAMKSIIKRVNKDCGIELFYIPENLKKIRSSHMTLNEIMDRCGANIYTVNTCSNNTTIYLGHNKNGDTVQIGCVHVNDKLTIKNCWLQDKRYKSFIGATLIIN